jgi:hypothetical protein
MLSMHGAVPVWCSLRCCPVFEFWLRSFTNQVKSQHSRHHDESQHQLLPLCRLPWCYWLLPCRESLLGGQWNVIVVKHILHMQTKWSEITSCKTLIQHKSDREQMRPLAASSMTSPMDARGHYQWLRQWTPHRDLQGQRQQIGPLALSMTSPMYARENYRWLHWWMPLRKGNKTIWSKTTCMNHVMGLKLTLEISKQEILRH